MEGGARLKNSQIRPSVLLSILPDCLDPRRRAKLLSVSLPRFRFGLSIVRTAKGSLERCLGETQLVANRLCPHGSSAARGDAPPPELPRPPFPNGFVPSRQNIVFPDLHQAVGCRIPTFGASPFCCFAPTLRLLAVSHHPLIFFQVTALFCRVLWREPRRPRAGQNGLLLFGDRKRVNHDVCATEGRKLGKSRFHARLDVVFRRSPGRRHRSRARALGFVLQLLSMLLQLLCQRLSIGVQFRQGRIPAFRPRRDGACSMARCGGAARGQSQVRLPSWRSQRALRYGNGRRSISYTPHPLLGGPFWRWRFRARLALCSLLRRSG
jgi:hypothetical protein